MAKKTRLAEEPELTGKICRLLKAGVAVYDACERVALPPSCFKDWMRWGTRAEGERIVAKEPFKSFAFEVNAALGEFKSTLLDEIRRQGRDARYANDVEVDRLDDNGAIVGKTVLHKKGDIILNPKGYVARPGHWNANAWLLSKRFPKEYAPQVRVIVEEQLTSVLKALERELEPEFYARVLDIISRADEADADAGSVGPLPPGAAPPAKRPTQTSH